MKKALLLSLFLLLLVTLTACGGGSSAEPSEDTAAVPPAVSTPDQSVPVQRPEGESQSEPPASDEPNPAEQENDLTEAVQSSDTSHTEQGPVTPSAEQPPETPPAPMEVEQTPSSSAPVQTEPVSSNTEQAAETDQAKILIAYFTWADNTYVEDPSTVDPTIDAPSSASILPPGDTARIAGWIQQQVGGDLHSIITEEAYSSDYDECLDRAIEEHDNGIRPALSSSVNVEDYDIVFLGYPNWWYTAPMCIRTFLEEYDFTGKTIVPFCTTMGAGVGQSVDEIKELCPDAVVLDGLTLSTGRDNEEKIKEWVDGLGLEFAPATQTGGEQTPITLTIGDTVLEAYLNSSVPAQSLLAQLPVTVSLNDSDNDFCGGSLRIDYSESDVQPGYHNGDLAFWPPASNFVIFVSDEENSADTGNLVILGHITSPQEALDALEGRIEVTIAQTE